ncbi:MAG: cyclic nucleotide-binding domain-containing protein [Planctomycetota bacterium]|nr:cyclic nucleotide-binding domain-containing protein [Planctomycetota bacterium]
MQSLEPYLAEHPFLKGLESNHLKILAGCASSVQFDAGQFILREGEDANNFYIIRHGKVAIELFAAERGAITIQTIGAGEILGWSWLIPPYQWRFDARAIEITRAIALDGKCLRTKCEQDHNLGYELLKRFAHVIALRLEATRLQLSDVYGVHP